MTFSRAGTAASCMVAAACLSGATSWGQAEPGFRELYARAEYERALSALAAPETSDAYQYKALCLLALGRGDEAAVVVHTLVTAYPTFTPPHDEVPPRFEDLVAATRRELLPVLARQAFAEGRDLFSGRQHDNAIERFSLVLALTADPAFEDRAVAEDMATLAHGFIDLARASKPAPTPPPADARPVARTPPKVTQAVALVQNVPPIPRDLVDRVAGPLQVRLRINETGRVTEAVVEQSANPRYDRMVVLAAREWRYTPATLDGVAVPCEQILTVQPER